MILPTVASPFVANPLAFGAAGDGVTNDEAAFLKAVATGRTLSITGTHALANTTVLQLAPGQGVIGPGKLIVGGGGTIFGLARSGFVRDVSVEGDASFSGTVFHTGANGASISVTGCTFRYATPRGTSVFLGQIASHCTVSNNTQTLGANLAFSIGSQAGIFVGNSTYQTRRPLQFFGGRHNVVNGNTLEDPFVGVNFLSFRQIGANNLMLGNVVSGNVVLRAQEEGISFDCHGNDAKHWPENPVVPIATVASAAKADRMTVIAIAETAAPNFAEGYYAVVLSGAAMGHTAPIEASTAGSIALSRSIGDITEVLAGGDRILVTTGAIRNVVANNVVRAAGTYGIIFYGSCWHNRAIGNMAEGVLGGVAAYSVVHLGYPAGVQCYSGCNVLSDNTCSCYAPDGDETKTTFDLDVGTLTFGKGAYACPVRNPYTSVRGNTLLSKGLRIADATNAKVRGNDGLFGVFQATDCPNLVQDDNSLGGAVVTSFSP